MTYATLMVHLALGQPNTPLLQITAELAKRFDAAVIGIAARQPLQMIYGDGYVAGDLYQRDRDEIAKDLAAAEAEFREVLHGRVAALEWQAPQAGPSLAVNIARAARSADLILTRLASGDFFDASRAVDTGELVMQAGRPVLLVPGHAKTLPLARVLVGWKDTRETRRAVADALPLLRQATEVTVVEIATDAALGAAQRHVADVVAWLARHGIRAQALAQRSTGDDATALYAIGQDHGADLIVAGAYGHSRLREWVLGGVTSDLLMSANRCALVSH